MCINMGLKMNLKIKDVYLWMLSDIEYIYNVESYIFIRSSENKEIFPNRANRH